MGKHLTPGEPYIYQEKDRLRIKSERDLDRYILRPGDVLYLSRGATTYPIIIEEVPDATVAPSTFFILTPRPNIVPVYLTWCLEQPQVEAQLAALRTGAGTPTIPRKGFMQITIPLPDLATQHRIADLWRLHNRERSLRQQLVAESTHLYRLAGQRIYDELTKIRGQQ
ncbi:restriction endonuclease subunit S [Desulfurivibrio sp. D14AmB]|uniref:restriction endonuclease subunit S n=1 Tax=Desulfurivibrio sp. D14AmB TaxID=3374370 RepID=UPI00376EEF1A